MFWVLVAGVIVYFVASSKKKSSWYDEHYGFGVRSQETLDDDRYM